MNSIQLFVELGTLSAHLAGGGASWNLPLKSFW